jgi:curli biogenesis system outer membrane secretion channel CsgG
MKKITVLIFLFLIVQGCAAYNQFQANINKSSNFPPAKEMKIGVLSFSEPAPGTAIIEGLVGRGTAITPQNSGVAVADAVASALMIIPKVVIIERSQLEKILNEHKLTLSGVLKNPDFELLGKVLPVDALVMGNVSSFHQWWAGVNWGATVAYSGRIVNIHTGEVLFTMNCNAAIHNGLTDRLADDLARDAIKKLLEK